MTAATREDIERWLDTLYAPKSNYSHMIVVCDTWDWDDFPVYVSVGEDIQAKVDQYQKASHSKVMEVYNRKLPKDLQMRQLRAYNLEAEETSQEPAQVRVLIGEAAATGNTADCLPD